MIVSHVVLAIFKDSPCLSYRALLKLTYFTFRFRIGISYNNRAGLTEKYWSFLVYVIM